MVLFPGNLPVSLSWCLVFSEGSSLLQHLSQRQSWEGESFSCFLRPVLQPLCLPLQYPLPFSLAQKKEPKFTTKIQSLSKRRLHKQALYVLYGAWKYSVFHDFLLYAGFSDSSWVPNWLLLQKQYLKEAFHFARATSAKLLALTWLFAIKQSCSIPPINVLLPSHHSFPHQLLLTMGQAFLHVHFSLTSVYFSTFSEFLSMFTFLATCSGCVLMLLQVDKQWRENKWVEELWEQ